MDGLEKYIKQALDRRRIDPSPGSWERLADRLPDSGAKKHAPWKAYALVACLSGILVLALWPRGEGEKAPGNDPWVQREGQLELGPAPKDNSKGKGSLGVPWSGPDPSPDGVAASKAPPENKGLERQLSLPELESRDSRPRGALQPGSHELILEKAREVVAQVEYLEGQRQQVTEGEVDSLLRAAQQQILGERIFQDEGAVDALALLAEVEGELDASFRERVFDALKAGYLKMRTAVAQRND